MNAVEVIDQSIKFYQNKLKSLRRLDQINDTQCK